MSNPNDQPVIPKAEPDVGPIQNEDTATAILRPKKSPNRLIVDEATADDNSVATLNPATMDTLGLFRGDTIIVRGKKRKDTVLICLSSDDIEEGKIALNKGMSFPFPILDSVLITPFPFSRSKQP
jgi:transitional endoplasmic reticulum ATPase